MVIPSFKVMLIDDHPIDTAPVKRLFSQNEEGDLELESVCTLNAALTRLAEAPFDMILMELSLPDSSGFDSFTGIYRRASHIPIIILTTAGNEPLASKALWAGAQDYLLKGAVSPEQIVRTIRYAIGRRRAEAAQNESERRNEAERKALEEMWRRYEFIVNTSKEFMTLISRDYRYEAANTSYCRAQNKPREDIVGKAVFELWGTGRYQEEIKATLDGCFAGNETHFQGWMTFSELGNRYMDVTYYPYYSPAGEVTHAVVVSRDITDRKHAEEALQQAHAQNQLLLASIPSILIGVNEEDLITHWNVPAEIAFDIPAAAVIGKPFLECGIQWDWLEILNRIANSREETRVARLSDVKYKRSTGKEGFLNITVNPFARKSGEQTGFLLVGEDVTERKVLESQLSHAQKLESIGQLAAGIAHEINTPTQYVGDNVRFFQESFADICTLLTQYQKLLETAKAGAVPADLLADIENTVAEVDLPFLVDEIPVAIEQSLQGIDHVSGIVRAMKEFSHPGVEEKTAIDINRAIESTITVARNEWKYVADVETDFETDLPPVPCLPGEFNQVILNMIINATHAIADVVGDGHNGHGTITLSTRRNHNWVEVRIKDTGTGIPEAVRSRIFDPFFTTKEVGKGTGQGLAISHAVIADKHNGTISFETEMGVGTTFIIRLPLDEAAIAGAH